MLRKNIFVKLAGSLTYMFVVPANFRRMKKMAKDVIGSVLVVGGGIAGMQSALDLANSGYYVYLLEKTPSIGGIMSQLDKTFPTNDCAM
jgi:heterodisulfide reductase subunit A-like polyferredoxin